MSLRFLRLAAFVAIVLSVNVASAEDGVLYWMIDTSSSSVGDDPLSTYFAGYATSDFAARVRVTGGDISGDVFLDIFDGSDFVSGSGIGGVFFDDDGVGSSTDSIQAFVPGSYLTSASPEYSFFIELGNIDSSDNWTTIAESAALGYEAISAYIKPTFDMNPTVAQIWNPTQFSAVPEPSGGLLTMMGLALLALRRKRFAEGA